MHSADSAAPDLRICVARERPSWYGGIVCMDELSVSALLLHAIDAVSLFSHIVNWLHVFF